MASNHLCFLRLVRCLLGDDAISERKLCHGNPLGVLGIAVEINFAGVTFVPEAEKVAKWRAQIEKALEERSLPGGAASKLVGAARLYCSLDAKAIFVTIDLRLTGGLNWTSQRIYRRIGRALLVALWKQVHNRSAEVDEECAKSLTWWLMVLKEGMCEASCLSHSPRPACACRLRLPIGQDVEPEGA